ncbi:MAG: hypothetical protein WBF83_11645 [Moheibacter sp.]
MKKIKWVSAVLFLGFLTVSCLDDERVDNINYQMKAIDSVDIQAVNGVREITEIKTYYTRLGSCEDFLDFDYSGFEMERRVALITWKVEGDSCTEAAEADYATLRFRPERPGNYTFKFWKGKDSLNQSVFIEKTITIE